MKLHDINIEDYNYPLPAERIASHPLAERDECKLLVRDGQGVITDHLFTDLPGLLEPDSMLIYNNTRVINARVRFRKTSGALIEVFCLEPVQPADYERSFASTDGCSWLCFVGNSKRWKGGWRASAGGECGRWDYGRSDSRQRAEAWKCIGSAFFMGCRCGRDFFADN